MFKAAYTAVWLILVSKNVGCGTRLHLDFFSFHSVVLTFHGRLDLPRFRLPGRLQRMFSRLYSGMLNIRLCSVNYFVVVHFKNHIAHKLCNTFYPS